MFFEHWFIFINQRNTSYFIKESKSLFKELLSSSIYLCISHSYIFMGSYNDEINGLEGNWINRKTF